MGKVEELALPGLMLLTPRVHFDARGFFLERWRLDRQLAAGLNTTFVQENLSRSKRGVLRGLHYQRPPRAQGKLVGVTRGKVFDVVVDLRRGSPAYGRWHGVVLDDETQQQLWVPKGFAHGFLVLSEQADVIYQVDDYHAPETEAGIRWNDAELAIDWGLGRIPGGSAAVVVSKRDQQLPTWRQVAAELAFP